METIINILITGIISIVVIGFLVFIHEFGHFWAAKRAGVFVQEFAFGFGKKLFAKKYKGTLYRINLFPFGGYVKMIGDLDGSSFTRFENQEIKTEDRDFALKLFKDNNIDPYKKRYDLVEEFYYLQKEKLSSVDLQKLNNFFLKEFIFNHPGNFENAKFSQRLFIITAGVIMNFIVAIIFFTLYFLTNNFVTFLPKIGDPGFIGANVSSAPILLIDYNTDNTPSGIILSINEMVIESDKELKDYVIQGRFENQTLNIRMMPFNSGVPTNIRVELDGEGIKTNYDRDFFDNVLINVAYEDGVASKAGINAGSIIVAINGEKINGDIEVFRKVLSDNRGQSVLIDYYDEFGKYVSKSVNLPMVQDGEPVLGVNLTSSNNIISRPVLRVDYSKSVFTGGISHSINMAVYNFTALGSLFSEAIAEKDITPVSQSVSSIFAVSDIFYSFVKVNNFAEILNITALISLTLAIMNILPIPLFDGGHVLFMTIEKIRGKKVSSRVQERIGTIAFYILIALSILIVIKDFIQFAWINRFFSFVGSFFK